VSTGLRVACGMLTTLLMSVGVSSAAAEPTLSLATGPDPVESITTQILASGSSASKDAGLSVTLKPTGGAGCGANFSADLGAGGDAVLNQAVAEGPFSKSVNRTFETAGSYLACGWLNNEAELESPVVARSSLTFTVRPPHLSLSISAPMTVRPAQTFQVVTTAQAEVTRTVEEYVLPNTGRGCPANAGAAAGTPGAMRVNWHSYGWSVNGGPFSESVNETLQSAGQYLVCAYVEYPSSQSPPELTASAAIAAVSPPPPCIVPGFTSTTRLRAIQRAIAAARCVVGKIRYAASRRIRSGYVSALSPAPGRGLPGGTAVNVTISTGSPCVVPRVFAGSALGNAERRVRLAHCAVGRVHTARSRRYRRGRVLRLGARAGQVLRSHAPIEIVISAGRHGGR
jgi:hypothetical protein